MAFTYTPDLATGNTIIDEEHKTLIEAINNLMVACSTGKGRTELESTCKFLQDYTAKHFAHEEQMQQQYKYPDYAQHKKFHDEFKRVVAELSAELAKEGATIALVGRVNTSIGGWFLNHIKREDVKVAAHIRAAQGK